MGGVVVGVALITLIAMAVLLLTKKGRHMVSAAVHRKQHEHYHQCYQSLLVDNSSELSFSDSYVSIDSIQ